MAFHVINFPYEGRDENGVFSTQVTCLGPYKAAGLLWACFHNVVDDGVGGITRFAAMFSSSDSGVTWNEADAAHHPQIAGNLHAANSKMIANGAFDGSVARAAPNDFYCVYPGTDGMSVKVTHFDFSTGLWGTTTDIGLGSDTSWFAPAQRARIVCLAGNKRYVFFDGGSGSSVGTTACVWAYFNGVLWTAAGGSNWWPEFDSVNFIYPRLNALCADATEAYVHLFFQAISLTGTGDAVAHRSIGVGTPLTLGAILTIARFDPGNTNGYSGGGSACTAFGKVFNGGIAADGSGTAYFEIFQITDVPSPVGVGAIFILAVPGTAVNGPFIGNVPHPGIGGGIQLGCPGNGSMVFDGTTLTAYFSQTVAGVEDVYSYSSTDGSTWSTISAAWFQNVFGPVGVNLPTASPLGFTIPGLVGRLLPAQSEGDEWVFVATGAPLPAPTCTLSSLVSGGSVTLTWTTANSPTSAVIDNGVGAVNPAGGSVVVPLPLVTTTYHLTVTNSSGSSQCQTTVTITPPVAVAGAVLEFVPFGGNGAYPGVAQGFGNVYTTPTDPLGDPILLTDDDYGQIFPYYTTYFFVNHEQEMALQLGAHRKMLEYFTALINGTGNITITALMNVLANAWPLNVTRALATQAIFDLEWPGANATAQRMAFKFASSPITGTDNGFQLEKCVATMKPATHVPVRGAAQ